MNIFLQQIYIGLYKTKFLFLDIVVLIGITWKLSEVSRILDFFLWLLLFYMLVPIKYIIWAFILLENLKGKHEFQLLVIGSFFEGVAVDFLCELKQLHASHLFTKLWWLLIYLFFFPDLKPTTILDERIFKFKQENQYV